MKRSTLNGEKKRDIEKKIGNSVKKFVFTLLYICTYIFVSYIYVYYIYIDIYNAYTYI